MEIHLPRRSINELIQSFQRQKNEFASQKELLDRQTVEVLERTLGGEFDKILDYSPINRLEAVVLVDFLLNELNSLDLRSTMPDQINAKILEVVASENTRHPANQN